MAITGKGLMRCGEGDIGGDMGKFHGSLDLDYIECMGEMKSCFVEGRLVLPRLRQSPSRKANLQSGRAQDCNMFFRSAPQRSFVCATLCTLCRCASALPQPWWRAASRAPASCCTSLRSWARAPSRSSQTLRRNTLSARTLAGRNLGALSGRVVRREFIEVSAVLFSRFSMVLAVV